MKLQIRQEREKRKWSQERVANQIGVSKQAIQQIENNQIKPSYDVLVKLLALFNYDDPRKLFSTVTLEEKGKEI